jgi:hypothetical protein
MPDRRSSDLGTAGPDLMGEADRWILAKKRNNDELYEKCHETKAVPANFTLELVTTAVFKAVNEKVGTTSAAGVACCSFGTFKLEIPA